MWGGGVVCVCMFVFLFKTTSIAGHIPIGPFSALREVFMIPNSIYSSWCASYQTMNMSVVMCGCGRPIRTNHLANGRACLCVFYIHFVVLIVFI